LLIKPEIVVIEANKLNFPDRRFPLRKKIPYGFDGNWAGQLFRETVDSGADVGKGDGMQTVFR
jgi:hypothetical protein